MKYLGSFLFPMLISVSVFSQDNYYWVGGQGNWSDLNHWQLENGSTPIDLPGIMNNVFFNANSFEQSFDAVSIDIINPACKSMIWENLPFQVILSGNIPNTKLTIAGSLHFESNVFNQFEGELEFVSTQEDNTIAMNGNHLNNDIIFNGSGGAWTLLDNLILQIDNSISSLYLIEGSLFTNGVLIVGESFLSDYQTPRILNIENSAISLYKENGNAWLTNCENLTIIAENSSINLTGQNAKFINKNGFNLSFWDINLLGALDSIFNINNDVSYKNIVLEGMYSLINGNFSAHSVSLTGSGSTLQGYSMTDIVMIGSDQTSIKNNHHIGKLIVNGILHILDSSYIEFGVFYKKSYFHGNCTFDTLVLLPAEVTPAEGNIFYFGPGTTQTINDSLYIRGNQCSNITLTSINTAEYAYLRKDYGAHDVSCDFLVINGVAAESATLNFYAGQSSSSWPVPPPGWLFENSPNYFYGFSGVTYEACWGDTLILNATNFNGWTNTEYFWNGSTIPGEITFPVTSQDTIWIRVQYAADCFIEDYAIVVFDSCENAVNETLSNKLISIFPNPTNGFFSIESHNNFEEINFILRNSNGVIVFNEMLYPTDTKFRKSFDFTGLSKGIYSAEFIMKSKTMSQKVILY
ncbi:MAG: T9SS type A sorting domain-containing protein [Bacteroidales bacterium]